MRNFSQNVDFESKNFNNEAWDFNDEHMFREPKCNSINWYTFDYVFDCQMFEIPTFVLDEINWKGLIRGYSTVGEVITRSGVIKIYCLTIQQKYSQYHGV